MHKRRKTTTKFGVTCTLHPRCLYFFVYLCMPVDTLHGMTKYIYTYICMCTFGNIHWKNSVGGEDFGRVLRGKIAHHLLYLVSVLSRIFKNKLCTSFLSLVGNGTKRQIKLFLKKTFLHVPDIFHQE